MPQQKVYFHAPRNRLNSICPLLEHITRAYLFQKSWNFYRSKIKKSSTTFMKATFSLETPINEQLAVQGRLVKTV